MYYAKTNSDGLVCVITTDKYVPDPAGWILVENGADYINSPLSGNYGEFLYKIYGGRIVDRPASELEEISRRAENSAEISELKAQLAATDYAVIKIAEGAAEREEYAGVIAQRQEWRNRINELETEFGEESKNDSE